MFKLSEKTTQRIIDITEAFNINTCEFEGEHGIVHFLYGAEAIELKGERYKYLVLSPLPDNSYQVIGTNSESELENLELEYYE